MGLLGATGLSCGLMSLHLRGVRVLVAEGPGADIASDLLHERGAVPVRWPEIARELTTAVDSRPGPAPIGLVSIPAGTPQDMVDQLEIWARERGIPIDDHRSNRHPRVACGEVTLVGGGPGDPELITVAGARAIEAADVVLVDHLGPIELAEQAAARGAEVIDVAKIPYSRQVSQEQINRLMIDHARAGRKVVRLKGGDPFIFGRGFEEVEACALANIPVHVVPGVTSMTSAPAAAGVSLTHRGLNHDITVVSGHIPPESSKTLVNWDAVAHMTGTLVLIMAVKNAGMIAAALIARGKAAHTPAVVVENASTPNQRVTAATLGTLGETIESQGLGAPAVIVIGDAAGKSV